MQAHIIIETTEAEAQRVVDETDEHVTFWRVFKDGVDSNDQIVVRDPFRVSALKSGSIQVETANRQAKYEVADAEIIGVWPSDE